MFGLFKKDNMQNMQDRGGETVWALGIHTVDEIVVNMQNGSVL